MSFLNEETREINCKIVYYGPSLSGSYTNMQYIYEKVKAQANYNSINEGSSYSVGYFDFLPIETYVVDGFTLRYSLHAITGVVYYPISREVILKDVDGIVFVADSQFERMDANLEVLWKLENNLKSQGNNLIAIPYVLQLNKRDLPNVLPIDELKKALMRKDEPVVEAIACKGIGVYETFTSVAIQIWQNIQNDKQPVKP